MTQVVHTTADLEYAQVDGVSLRLDIHRPQSDEPVPAVAYFHGGGWRRGSRADHLDTRLLRAAGDGIAIVSVSYRLLDVATHPAQLHDAKAAVRWLRAHGAEHGLKTDRIGAWGASAGGWIALMLGFTAGNAELDGEVGDEARTDSSVQAVAAWFPLTNLATIASERDAGAPAAARVPDRATSADGG